MAAVLYVNALPASVGEGLPSQLGGFEGRLQELDQLESLVARCRVVTITGPGGVGKTSLALEAAKDTAAHGTRTRFVDLVPCRNEASMHDALAASFGMPVPADAFRKVRFIVGAEPFLLVLDNAEQVASEVCTLVEALAPCTELKVLDYEPPAAPDARRTRLGGAAIDRRRRARRLLEARAPIELDRHAVCALCQAVDGVPLAIELVAARLPVMGVRSVLEHLDRLPELLSTPASGRHET